LVELLFVLLCAPVGRDQVVLKIIDVEGKGMCQKAPSFFYAFDAFKGISTKYAECDIEAK
jgi:hypothetical protein